MVVTVDTDKWQNSPTPPSTAKARLGKPPGAAPPTGTLHPVVGMRRCHLQHQCRHRRQRHEPSRRHSITCDFSLSTDKKKYTGNCVAKTKDGKQANQTLVYGRTRWSRPLLAPRLSSPQTTPNPRNPHKQKQKIPKNSWPFSFTQFATIKERTKTRERPGNPAGPSHLTTRIGRNLCTNPSLPPANPSSINKNLNHTPRGE